MAVSLQPIEKLGDLEVGREIHTSAHETTLIVDGIFYLSAGVEIEAINESGGYSIQKCGESITIQNIETGTTIDENAKIEYAY